jgi:two-component system, OmpR family, sensor kinase
MSAAAETRRRLSIGRAGLAARIGRLPVRMRLTLSFAVVMVVLFGLIALLLYFTFEAGLDTSINTSLNQRVSDLQPGINRYRVRTPLSSKGAQIVDARTGSVLDPKSAAPLLGREQRRGPGFSDHGGDRMLVAPLHGALSQDVLVVGASLSQRNGALNTLAELLFVGGPIALLIACAAGYVLAERVLAPVERMRQRAAGISGARSGARLPVPDTRDELQALGETLNEMLARLDAALERERVLVALASHELRTPLSIIKLELELALAPDRSRTELEEALRSVIEEVERLTVLAQDMLTVAGSDQQGLPLEHRHIDVAELLHATADRVVRATGADPAEVIVEAPGGLALWADRGRVERALGNMVDNAVRHGRAPIELRAQAAGPNVELHVRDHGPGFPASFLPHAFERFSRANPAHPSTGGTGLGLAIVRAIAEAHGGSADASNDPGGGAHVRLRMPARPADRAPERPALSASP